MVVRRNFQGGATSKCAYSLQVADSAMQMDVHKTLYRFYPSSLCWLNLKLSTFRLKCFLHFGCQKCFFFHKLPNIHFFDHFLQIAHILRISTARTTSALKKKECCTLSQKCFKQWEVKYMLTKLSDNLLKLEHHAGLKLSRWTAKTRHSKYNFALSAH